MVVKALAAAVAVRVEEVEVAAPVAWVAAVAERWRYMPEDGSSRTRQISSHAVARARRAASPRVERLAGMASPISLVILERDQPWAETAEMAETEEMAAPVGTVDLEVKAAAVGVEPAAL